MDSIRITPATLSDSEALLDIFWNHITSHPEYISHGELQMGVGEEVTRPDGDVLCIPAKNGRQMWLKYINEHLSSAQAAVFKAVSGEKTVGFCVADIEEDGAEPFGMVCDVLVVEEFRGLGLGKLLLAKAIEWLKSRNIRGIYLESGKDNASAHKFFERRGFRHISEIYKLSR